MAKTRIEQIESKKEKILQWQNQIKKLIREEKEAERKARTRRLIERGAIVESLMQNAETLTNEQFKAIIEKALNVNYAVVKTDVAKAEDGAG